MNSSQIYMVVVIISLSVIVSLVFLANGNSKNKRLTPMAYAAFGFILVGIIFGESRLIGYSLIGVGVLLSVVDIYKKSKKSV